MAWWRIGDKPLSEPMLTQFTDIYAALGGDELNHSTTVHAVPSFMSSLFRVHSCQGEMKFLKVREFSGNFTKCQGKFDICKIYEKRHGITHNVRENDHFRQHDSPVDRISTKQLNRDFEIFSTKYFFKYSHYGLKIVLLTSSSFPGVAYFGICSLEPVIYTFVITFCEGNMNTVREKSETSGNFEEACCYEPCSLKFIQVVEQ